MMRFPIAFLFCVVLSLVVAPSANAVLTGGSCDDDGDGAIVMSPASLNLETETLEIVCSQSDSPGHILGDFTTDTELDPTVRIMEYVYNDTDFAWTDYHITIGMTKSFSISNIVTPEDWTYTIDGPAVGMIPNGGGLGWVGTINYYVGTGAPIAMDEEGEFGFKLSFTGGIAFCMEQVPTPEPATVTMLGFGALALMRKRRA
jgi:hypothetical protein